jgi:N-acyl-D-amino-acid deacylase
MSRKLLLAAVSLFAVAGLAGSAAAADTYDVIVRGGTVYDGSGKTPFVGDVAIKGDRIAYIGPKAPGTAAKVIDAKGKAVSPGFINMLSWATETLLVDGRALSDLKQGVTLEVFGEGTSMGPVNADMKRLSVQRMGDIKYDITWDTLGQYMETLEKKGIAPNVASFIGAATPRQYVLGEGDVDPTPEQQAQMEALVKQAMEEGAMGVGSSMIYAPASYAETPELVGLMKQAGKCGGMYITHMRSEGNRINEAVAETIDIARQSGAPAEIYHLKMGGKTNWSKLDSVIKQVEDARAEGLRITADMYTYTAGSTGLDAGMPPWVQDGGLEAWIERLKDPAIRARVAAEMQDPTVKWENLMYHAGPEGTLLVGFKTDALKPLAGKTLAEVAKMRGKTPQETAMDLVVEDGTRVQVVYFLMSEDNVKRQIAIPWVSFDSDAEAPAPEGVFLKSSTHPRTYGNFARLLGKYVRDEKVIPLQEAIRKLTFLPATNLSLKDRGQLKAGYFADVVVFDPATIQDHATFEKPHQLSTGVSDVLVNGKLALANGEATGAATGRFVRGRAWTGNADGGCRASAKDWSWQW